MCYPARGCREDGGMKACVQGANPSACHSFQLQTALVHSKQHAKESCLCCNKDWGKEVTRRLVSQLVLHLKCYFMFCLIFFLCKNAYFLQMHVSCTLSTGRLNPAYSFTVYRKVTEIILLQYRSCQGMSACKKPSFFFFHGLYSRETTAQGMNLCPKW